MLDPNARFSFMREPRRRESGGLKGLRLSQFAVQIEAMWHGYLPFSFAPISRLNLQG